MIHADGTKQRPSVPICLILILAACLLCLPANVLAKDVSFVWSANQEQVTGYKLYYKTGTDLSEPYHGVGLAQGDSPIIVGDVSTYTVTGLADDENYQFVLTAYNDYGESEYSAVVTIPGSAPETKSVSFTWSPNQDAITGYKLYYEIGENFQGRFDGTGLQQGDSPIMLDTATSLLVTGLAADQTYHFALTAVNESAESEFSEVVTIRSEPVPVIINIQKGDS